MSANGSTIVVGATGTGSGSSSIGPGGVFRFARTGSTWSQTDYTTIADDYELGSFVAISDDASILAVATRAPNPVPTGLAFIYR